jgi:hypothetical protein
MVLWNEKLFGHDTDHLFAFTTQKVVWIRNRWIGGLYYFFVASVILWLFLVRILIRNDHFVRKDVTGVARMWYSHPTWKDCESSQEGCMSNYERLVDLPYCDVYKGELGLDKQAHCEFLGKISLVPSGSSDNELFVTTAVEVVTERRACNPGPDNGYKCQNEYEALKGTDCLRNDIYLCKNRSGLTNQFFYVADATDYRIQMTSTYERDEIRGTSLMHRGHVASCSRQNRLANDTRTWAQRQSGTGNDNEECADRMDVIPCSKGATCAKPMRQFDFFGDTGVRKLFTGLQLDTREQDGLDNETSAQGGDSQWPPPQAVLVPFAAPLAGRAPGASSWGRSLLQTAQQTASSSSPTAPVERNGGSLELLQISAANEDAAVSADVRSWRSASAASVAGTSSNRPFQEYSNPWGDVFSVARLLELAGCSLDRDFNMDGWSARQGGIALEVSAVYNNLYPILSTFGYRPVRYHYEVRELMLPYVSRTTLSEVQPDDYPMTRRYEVRYGVLIHFKVAGTFGTFSIAYFLLMLSTAFALTATARTITDKIALHVHPHRENFFHMKYEVSPDFSELWTCPKCGFKNTKESQTCQRIPRWTARGETPVCGVSRPDPGPS